MTRGAFAVAASHEKTLGVLQVGLDSTELKGALIRFGRVDDGTRSLILSCFRECEFRAHFEAYSIERDLLHAHQAHTLSYEAMRKCLAMYAAMPCHPLSALFLALNDARIPGRSAVCISDPIVHEGREYLLRLAREEDGSQWHLRSLLLETWKYQFPKNTTIVLASM